MPEPTMMPETIITESNSPSALRNSPACAGPPCDSKPCTSALKLMPPASRELCHYLEATRATGHNHRSVAMASPQPTGFAVHSDARHAFAFRRPEGYMQLLRQFARRRQSHRCNQLITTSLEFVAHMTVACRRLFNRNRLACRHPVARDGATEVQPILIVVLED